MTNEEKKLRQAAKARGLRIYTMFQDSYNSSVRVQSSSSAKRRCVWIFCTNKGPEWAQGDYPAPHLTVAQARRVRDALDRFIRGAR